MSGLEIIEKYQIPDKPDFYATTSHRFKLDLFDFFNDHKDKVLIEFGTSRGFTSVFCSRIFKNVHTINIQRTKETDECVGQVDNIDQYVIDLCDPDNVDKLRDIEKADVYIVDALHSYNAIINDTFTAKEHCNEGAYIVYDDYGTYPEIKKAVDELIEQEEIRFIKYIGHEAGWSYGEGGGVGYERTLQDREGVICQIL